MSTKTYNLNISKVLNGWVVMNGAEAMVVKEDEELGPAIAAMLVAERFAEPPAATEKHSANKPTGSATANLSPRYVAKRVISSDDLDAIAQKVLAQ